MSVITKKELEVLRLVKNHEGASLGYLFDVACSESVNSSYWALATFLYRLKEKGYVKQNKKNNGYIVTEKGRKLLEGLEWLK